MTQLDQSVYWVLNDGCVHRIDSLEIDTCIEVIDWMLANAKMLRQQWSIQKREVYPESQRARRWILDRPALRAIMKQIVRKEELNDNGI